MSTKRVARFTRISHATSEAAKMLQSLNYFATNPARIAASSDKMDDLQPITIVQLHLVPLCARHDFAIQFYGHPISLHPKLLDELGQRRWIGATFRLSIYQ
jgi:hypothetical protein